jgi:hypothetical protein
MLWKRVYHTPEIISISLQLSVFGGLHELLVLIRDWWYILITYGYGQLLLPIYI